MGFGGAENKKRFNGYELQNKEFSDGTGLEWYDYKNRFYDNQIGRFFCQDRLADDYLYYTPYQFAGNEVPNAIDLDGLEPSRRNPLAKDYSETKSSNPSMSTSNRSATQQQLIANGSLGKPKVDKSSVKAPQLRNGGGIKGTSESGQGADVIATHPDEKPVNIDGIVAGFGALEKTVGGALKEFGQDRAWSIIKDHAELKQSAEDQKGGLNDETGGGGNPDMTPATQKTSENNRTDDSKLKPGTIYYSRGLGQNLRKEVNGSTCCQDDKKATDTVPRRKN